MRVLHVINSLAIGGAEVLICDLVPRLRQRGVDASIAVLQRAPTRLEAAIAEMPGALFDTGLNQPRSPKQIRRLAKLFDGYDIIHSHIFPSQLWVAAARRFTPASVKLVTTEHNPDNRRRGKKSWLWFDRWMYAQYDAIVCNSQATADALHRECPSLHSPVVVVPNGIDVARFQGRRAGSGKFPTAIFVGRLEPQKDHLTLLRALRLVDGLRLQLVGDGSLRRELEQYVAEAGLGDRVDFLGHRDDIPALLSQADIYVHATHSDGFAIAMVEAMASRLPVVASHVPGLSWVLGDAGLLCKPGDSGELAAQLLRVVSDSSLRQELASRARGRAQQFSIEATVDAHILLYNSLVADTKSTAVVATGSRTGLEQEPSGDACHVISH